MERGSGLFGRENFRGNPPASVLKLLQTSGVLCLFQDVLLEGLVTKEDRERFLNVMHSPIFSGHRREAQLAAATEDEGNTDAPMPRSA